MARTKTGHRRGFGVIVSDAIVDGAYGVSLDLDINLLASWRYFFEFGFHKRRVRDQKSEVGFSVTPSDL
jgi:hypothetical protein